MILFIITMVIGVLIVYMQHIHLKSIYHRQVVEARFRVLHSEASEMLFEGVFVHKKLSHTDLVFLRHMVDRLSLDIAQIRTNRRKYFTLYNYLQLSIEGRRNEEKHALVVAQDEQLISLQRRAGEAMSMAFRVFVPWLRFRVLYMLMRVGLYMLVLIGLEQFRGVYEQVQFMSRNHSGRLG